jgi:hypothetical protein
MGNFFGGGASRGAFASGGTVANVIPKSNGAGALADSSITDDGTTVTTGEILNLTRASDTTNAIIRLNSTAAYGVMSSGANAIGLKVDATNWMLVANNTGNQLQIPSTGVFGWSSSTSYASANNDTVLRRRAAANIAMGLVDVNGVPVAQTLSVQNAITGTDLPGSTWTLDAPLGTGAGAGSKTVLNRALMRATGTTAQTSANAFAVCESKTLSNTSATTTALATIGLPSNSGGGAFGIITVVATDGTNFDTDSQSFNVSFVNKAGAITISTAQITTASPASNSGSTTCGITVTAGASLVNINVTPVFTTIVPTTVTAYLQLFSNGTGAITAL